jgi:eukaryotic-like serine/threonine-protein kinase
MSSDLTAAPDDRTDLLDLTRTLAAAVGDGGQALAPGTRFGRYILLSALGEGGMGAVYLAEQTEPVRRKVAIKLSRQRRVSAEELARFAVERQALARMSHPAIAQVYDAGTVEDGTPYFVMEYVEGERLTDFCRSRGLDLAARVELMRRVCLGVAHAHQKGVIHCDLKPGNILATEVDGQGQPKIIDFGIARALGAGSRDGSSGTPGYMSPEQARSAGDIDTRTDVYSLGLLLYELVAGKPYRDLERLGELSMEAMRETLAGEPPRPLPEVAGLSASRRRELDAILSRALAPKPEQRYEGAAQLAEDLGRWQGRLPVLALPDTSGYRLRCMLRRHALAASIGALALAALVAGLVGTGYGLLEANAQRAEAEARQAELEKVVAFQQNMLGQIDLHRFANTWRTRIEQRLEGEAETVATAIRSGLRSLPLVDVAREALHAELLTPAAQVIEGQFADNRMVQAMLRASLGTTLLDISLFEEARLQLDQAASVMGLPGEQSRRAAFQVALGQARMASHEDRSTEALDRYDALLRAAERAGLGDDPLVAEALSRRGLVLSDLSRMPEALADLDAAIAMYEALGMTDRSLRLLGHRGVTEVIASGACRDDLRLWLGHRAADLGDASADARASIHQALGWCHNYRGAYRAAAEHFGAAYALARERVGDDDLVSQRMKSLWLNSRMGAGDLDGLEEAFRALVAESERVHGEDNSSTIFARTFLVSVLSQLGRHEHALALIDREMARMASGGAQLEARSAQYVRAVFGLARLEAGQVEQALAELRSVVDECRALLGEDYSTCVVYAVAAAEKASGPAPDAFPVEALEALSRSALRSFPTGHPYPVVATWLWAQALERSGHIDEAKAGLRERVPWAASLDPAEFGFMEAPIIRSVKSRLGP